MEEDYSENITLVIDYVIKNNDFFLVHPIPDIHPTIPIPSIHSIQNIPIPIPNVNFDKWDSGMQTDIIDKWDSGIQTDEIIVEKGDFGIQTDEIIVEKGDFGIQTDEIIVEKGDFGLQTDEIIVEKSEKEMQTDEIIVEKSEKEMQTDIIFNNNIETQTENMSSDDVPEVIKQLLPDILVENLSSDILLKISKVLSNKNEDVENKKKEIIEKENEIYLRDLKITEMQAYSMRNEEQNQISPTPIPTNQIQHAIPKLIFVVPYRDREQQYRFFHKQMTTEILSDYPQGSYKIWYIHQCDSRDFNRGAMKNIGFLVAKQLYPYDYKNITLVFNDVDTMPFNKNFLHYETSPGIVKHFYGYDFALGGIVSMNAHDFERINGYPNLWGWGFEDNCLQVRVKKTDIQIDRGQFYPILDKNILQVTDGVTRIVNRNEFDQYYHNTSEGINSINNLNYDIDETTGFVNIRGFNTGREQDLGQRKVHDLRNGPAPFHPNDNRGVRKVNNRMKLFM